MKTLTNHNIVIHAAIRAFSIGKNVSIMTQQKLPLQHNIRKQNILLVNAYFRIWLKLDATSDFLKSNDIQPNLLIVP